MKKLLFVLSLVVAASIGVAEPKALLSGGFVLTPTANNHPNPLNGNLELVFDQNTLVNARITVPTPLFGKTSFDSKEQAFFTLTQPGKPEQISATFKLKAVPHTWYFVYVMDWNETNKVYQGMMFKAKGDAAGITGLLQKGIALGTGPYPADWKAMGTVTLKQVP